MSALVQGARSLGIDLSAAQLDQLARLGASLREWNQRVNLTRITDPAEVEVRHFLDSLTAAIPLLPALREGYAPRLIDVGTGAGFPALPLKVAFPAIRLTLLEATAKKAAFLRHAVQHLGLQAVEVLVERAETAARDPGHRDRYDWATARALGPLPVVVELCAPFLAPGGLLVAQRRGDLEAELRAASAAFQALKVAPRAPVPIALPGLADGRGLVVGEKYDFTPERYPRRAGIPNKRPIRMD